MKGFSLRMARKKIISKTKAKKLLEMIDNLEVMPSGNLKHIDLADIKVAAMSVTAKTYSGLFDYIADMNAYVQKAREEGAQKNKDCKEAAREETPQKKMTEEKESGENL